MPYASQLTRQRFLTQWQLAVLLIALLSFVSWLHQQLIARIDRLSECHQSSVLPDPRSVKFLSLGYDQLLADLLWLELVQYTGDAQTATRDHYASAKAYVDNIVALDPHFVQVYWFAAFLIGGESANPQAAASILENGISANPTNWYLPFIAGINQYLYAHNEVAASRYYRMAAKFPQAPKWLSRQADILEAHIPSIVKEINTWDTIYRSNSGSQVTERARRKLISLWQSVYRCAPSQQIKNRAISELARLMEAIPTHMGQ